MVLVPKVIKIAVFRHLFKNNSVAFEDTNRTQDIAEITYKNEKGEDVHPRNLYVNMIMNSLKSRGYVKDTFAWRHHYYLLTETGEKYIRKELDIEDTIRPDPCVKQIAQKPVEEKRERQGFAHPKREYEKK